MPYKSFVISARYGSWAVRELNAFISKFLFSYRLWRRLSSVCLWRQVVQGLCEAIDVRRLQDQRRQYAYDRGVAAGTGQDVVLNVGR